MIYLIVETNSSTERSRVERIVQASSVYAKDLLATTTASTGEDLVCCTHRVRAFNDIRAFAGKQHHV